MLDPKIIVSLVENANVKKLMAFMGEEISKLNTLDGIKAEDPVLVAIEIKARKLARGKLKDILEPLINANILSVDFKREDYTVDVIKKKKYGKN